jgi:hypothetical protein
VTCCRFLCQMLRCFHKLMTTIDKYEHLFRCLDLSLSNRLLISDFYWSTHISSYDDPFDPFNTSDTSYWSCFGGEYTPSSTATIGEGFGTLHHILNYWYPILTFADFDVIFVTIRWIPSQYHLCFQSRSRFFHLPYMIQLSTNYWNGWLTGFLDPDT